MRLSIRILLAVIFAATAARADDLDDARQAAARADADLKRLTALRPRGLASDLEVLTAEFQAHVARATVARLANDEKEDDLRELAVKTADAILKRVEGFQKKGIAPVDEVDRWKKNAALARIELAAIRGKTKEIVAQLEIVVGVEERRLARVQKLFERGAVARGELDGQRQALAEAKHRLKQALGDEP